MRQRTSSTVRKDSFGLLVLWRLRVCVCFPALHTTASSLSPFAPAFCSSLLTAFEQEALLDSSYFFCKQDSVVAAAQLLGQVRGRRFGLSAGRGGGGGAVQEPLLACICMHGSAKAALKHHIATRPTPPLPTLSVFCAAAAVCERHVQLLHGPRQRHGPAPGRRAAPVRHQIQVGGKGSRR